MKVSPYSTDLNDSYSTSLHFICISFDLYNLCMSTVFSILSLNHNYGAEDSRANHQESHQIYSSIFKDAANSPYHKDLDFDISDAISKAVNSFKENYQSKSCSKQANIGNPCSICCKSVNKNQHGIFCTTCLKWYHRKCNGTSLKDYESLRNENDDIPC